MGDAQKSRICKLGGMISARRAEIWLWSTAARERTREPGEQEW
jgi:hypothetical protein